MKAPDKIYVAVDSELGFKNTKTAIAFSFEQKFDTVEYICKDALLEWAKEQASTTEKLNGKGAMLKAWDILIDKIESLEKEPKGKTNPLFEECLANVDSTVRKEVSDNIDKMLEKEQDAPNIKGWVARDNDNALFFHSKNPQKFHEDRIAYWANGGYRFMIPQSMQAAFLKICTTDEPIEVELTISRIIK